jgi:tripartite ATP-independent transporter DctM subunit
MTGVTLAILLVFLAASIPVAAVMGFSGLVFEKIYSAMPLNMVLGDIAWQVSHDFVLVAIPLFIMLGEILLRSGIAEKMYGAAMHWLSWLPGGLMHSNIGACTMFAAISGSSVATAATIGTVAVGQITKRRYNERLFLGSIAAGGTLGILIPPSINLIIYGVMTDTSIPQLYLAGFIPGFVLSFLFLVIVFVSCLIRPAWGGTKIETSWTLRWRSLPDLVPPLIIFVLVIGTIYAGIATPTESAALGVVAALVLAASRRRLTWPMLRAVLEGTTRSTAMVMAILIAAYFLNFIFTSIGLTAKVSEVVIGLGWSPMETMVAIILVYVVLGFFLESLSMMVATVPIVTPLVVSLGFDPVWFGILVMVLIETALITPPVGMNLFVVQGVRTEPGSVNDVMIGAAPFVLAMFVMIALLVVYPNIALWLPNVAQ